ncbi:unnamed protein product [Brassica oleracea]
MINTNKKILLSCVNIYLLILMEAFEELIATSKEQSLILKGKRTKRQRPQSPVPFSISPPIVSCPARDVIEEYTYLDSKENTLGNNVENHKKDGVITSSSPSASWSFNNNPTTLKVEEDEKHLDIASCLILLFQGHSLPHLKIPNHETNNNNTYKFSCRRFLETSSSNSGGKTDSYVYQCKTCDWTFSSFQALGGHRDSHKKHKATSFYSNLEHIFVYDDMYLQTGADPLEEIIMSGLYMLGFQVFNK